MKINSKLPNVGTNIFTVMSKLANESNAINLSQGFPNFDCPDALKQRVNFHMQNGKNQYAPMPGLPLLRERIAEKIRDLYNYNLDPNTEITVVAGATQGLFTAINAYVHPGDEAILIEPAYDSYAPAIRLAGGTPISYLLHKPDYTIDWDRFAQLITPKTRMIVINTPHNPIGKTLKESDMKALEKLTEHTDIIILSDEVYEHLVFDGAEHQSILKFPELMSRSITVSSFGKTFHNTGWKIGYVTSPKYLMTEFRKVHQFNVFTVNSFVQYGIADFLEDKTSYTSLPSFYQQKRDFFLERLEGSRFDPIRCEGTYFQLFDYSRITDEPDLEFAKRLTTEFGVAAIPVSAFYSNQLDEKVIRLCFAKTEDLLEKAGNILRKI